MLTKFFGAFIACALLTACASPGPIKGMPERVETIGIASSVSPRLVLSNGADEQKIDWDLNAKLVKDASALLQGRYKVVPFVVNPTEEDKNKPAIDRLRPVVSPGAVDLLIVAEPPDYKTSEFDNSPSTYAPTDAIRVQRSGEGRVTTSSLSYQWEVFDGKTLKPLARSIALMPPERNQVEAGHSSQAIWFVPVQSRLDVGWHGESYSTMARPNKEAVDSALDKLLAVSVATTLHKLGFVDRSTLNIYDTSLPIGPTMATLVGSRSETPALQKDMRVHIAAIDGRSTMLPVSQFTKVIAVQPGRHEVRIFGEQYPDADGLATVSMTFEPGKHYVVRASPIGTAATVQQLVFDCCRASPTPSAWIEEAGGGAIVSELAPLDVRYRPLMIVPIPIGK